MSGQDLIPHLFRIEFSRIVAVLVRQYGLRNIETAEDIAGETFLAAIESWPYKGIPENPSAWLYAVAKNKTVNQLKRKGVFREKVTPAIGKEEAAPDPTFPELTEDFISDSQLRMFFAVCHPSIAPQAQIALALRVLCGFGVDEIADALLASKEAVNKRLYRAKKSLQNNDVDLELPSETEIESRLETVLRIIYLIFSEGYYSESHDETLRKELCHEAIRLAHILLENNATDVPQARALLALMYFHASRFDARTSENQGLVLYGDQDPTLWNREYIETGALLLRSASGGETLTKYHLEAAIAFWHTDRTDSSEKWAAVLRLYDLLLERDPSPVAALNRIYAFSKVHGKEAGIAEASKLPESVKGRFYYALLGDLYEGLDDSLAESCFRKALSLAGTSGDRTALMIRLEKLAETST